MRKILLLPLLFLFLTSCDRELIPTTEENFVGFQFFLFMKFDGEKFQGNGDAVLLKGSLFKFRVYDNLIEKHLMTYECSFDGFSKMYLPISSEAVEMKDEILSAIFTDFLWQLFEGGEIDFETKTLTWDENGRLESASFDYYDEVFTLEVENRFDDGRLRTIKLGHDSNEDDYIYFDIIEYQEMDFPGVEESEYTLYSYDYNTSFFGWIEAAYGG